MVYTVRTIRKNTARYYIIMEWGLFFHLKLKKFLRMIHHIQKYMITNNLPP